MQASSQQEKHSMSSCNFNIQKEQQIPVTSSTALQADAIFGCKHLHFKHGSASPSKLEHGIWVATISAVHNKSENTSAELKRIKIPNYPHLFTRRERRRLPVHFNNLTTCRSSKFHCFVGSLRLDRFIAL
ncbi:hypothetical protein ACLOJK_013061 [Asimina triloba]